MTNIISTITLICGMVLPNATNFFAPQENKDLECIIKNLEMNFGIHTFNHTLEEVLLGNESHFGYVVDFNFNNNEKGYFIYSDLYNQPIILEIDLETSSLFSAVDGVNIYPSLGRYFFKVNNKYYDALNFNEVSKNNFNSDKFYASLGNLEGSETTIDIPYKYGTAQIYEIEGEMYYQYKASSANKKNNCANAAGVIMLNYRNNRYNNDILKLSNNEKIVGTQNMNTATAIKYMNIFYEYMSTNLGTDNIFGTLPMNASSGFERLIKECGYSHTTQNISSWNDIKKALDNDKTLLITSFDYTFTTGGTLTMPSYSDEDEIHMIINAKRRNKLETAHTFVGYGYFVYNMVGVDGSKWDEHFIRIADGWGNKRYYYWLGSTTYRIYSYDIYK